MVLVSNLARQGTNMLISQQIMLDRSEFTVGLIVDCRYSICFCGFYLTCNHWQMDKKLLILYLHQMHPPRSLTPPNHTSYTFNCIASLQFTIHSVLSSVLRQHGHIIYTNEWMVISNITVDSCVAYYTLFQRDK